MELDQDGQNEDHANPSQVRVQLDTTAPDIAFPQNPGPILVNTNFRRYALSTLVNTILGREKAIPFEFLINGQFLRTSIDEYLTEHGISAETTLSIEYVRAVIPPLYQTSFQHDDWVSSVDVASASSESGEDGMSRKRGGYILSGSYDGTVNVWNSSSEKVASIFHSENDNALSPVKAVSFLSSTHIVSAGMDRSLRLWKLVEAGDQLPSATLNPKLELYGHEGSIDSVAVHEASQRLLSASMDHSVGLWSSSKAGAPVAPPSLLPSAASRRSKRRKVGPAVSTPQRGPLSLLRSHTAPVSSVIFAPKDSTVAHSASWDHSLKTWDLPTGSCVDTRTTSHSLLSLASLPSLNLLAVGTSARHITLVDPRAAATTISAMTLRGHSNAVVSLATDPSSTFGLLSGSHDGTCRIWDIRSSKSDKDGRTGDSVYCIERESAKGEARKVAGEGIKVFGVCWDQEIGIVSAGEDKRIQINRSGS